MLSIIISALVCYFTNSISYGLLTNNLIQVFLLKKNIKQYLFLTLNILIYLFFGWSYLFFIKIYLLCIGMFFYFEKYIHDSIKTKDIIVNNYNKINNIIHDNVKFIFSPIYNKTKDISIIKKIIDYKNKITNNDVFQLINLKHPQEDDENIKDLDLFLDKFMNNNIMNEDINNDMTFEDMFNQDKVLEMANNLRNLFGKQPLDINDERIAPMMKFKIT